MTTELLKYINELKEECQAHYDAAKDFKRMGYPADAAIEFAEWYRLDSVIERLESIIEKCEDLCADPQEGK